MCTVIIASHSSSCVLARRERFVSPSLSPLPISAICVHLLHSSETVSQGMTSDEVSPRRVSDEQISWGWQKIDFTICYLPHWEIQRNFMDVAIYDTCVCVCGYFSAHLIIFRDQFASSLLTPESSNQCGSTVWFKLGNCTRRPFLDSINADWAYYLLNSLVCADHTSLILLTMCVFESVCSATSISLLFCAYASLSDRISYAFPLGWH